MSLRKLVTYSGFVGGGLALPIIYLLNNEAINRFLMPPESRREELLYDFEKLFPNIYLSMGAAVAGATIGTGLAILINKAITHPESRLQNLLQQSPNNLKIRTPRSLRHHPTH